MPDYTRGTLFMPGRPRSQEYSVIQMAVMQAAYGRDPGPDEGACQRAARLRAQADGLVFHAHNLLRRSRDLVKVSQIQLRQTQDMTDAQAAIREKSLAGLRATSAKARMVKL